MRKILLAPLAVLGLLALAAPAAHASEAKKEGAETKSAQYVDITPVALPIVVDGRLVNYVFVQVRLNLAPGADATKLREKEPYLRDALVRVAHRTPFTSKTDYMHVDEPTLKSAVSREVTPLIGARNVASVQIMMQQPKQRVGLPRPPA